MKPDRPVMGRPPRSDVTADEIITVRVTTAEKATWLSAAQQQPLAAWIRDRCNRSAARRER